MIEFAVEPFSKAYPEAKELLILHWEEVAPYKDILHINPDLDRYHQLESQGNLCLVTARDNGNLIGYILMIVHQHLHYKHIKVASDDMHFIHKDHRLGGLGLKLLATAEKVMTEQGVGIMTLRAKAAQDHSKLFVRLGFEPLDVTYSKRLGV